MGWNRGYLSTPTLDIEERIVTEPSDEEKSWQNFWGWCRIPKVSKVVAGSRFVCEHGQTSEV